MWKIVALSVVLSSNFAFADGPSKGQIRLFGGTVSASADEANSELKTAGINEVKSVISGGVEASAPIFSTFNLGIRYAAKYAKVKETAAVSANPSNPYYGAVQAESFMGVARLALVSSSFFVLDVFGSAGVQDGKLEIRNSSGNGIYENKKTTDWMSQYGASMGLGFSDFLLFAEVGQEVSRLSNLERTGNTNNTIEEINTGGPFVYFGIILNNRIFGGGKGGGSSSKKK